MRKVCSQPALVLMLGLLFAVLPLHLPAAELKLTPQATVLLFQRCKAFNPPLDAAQCSHYVAGVSEGYCLGSQPTVAEARRCTEEKRRELEASLREIKRRQAE